MEGNGYAFIHRPFKMREVGNDGLEYLVAKGVAYLSEVSELEGTSTLEFRYNVPEEF